MNKKKAKLFIALIVIIGGIGGLVYTSMQSTVTYYMKPSELLAKVAGEPDSIYGERIRVGGAVVKKTIKGSAASRKWEFVVTDDKSGGSKMELVSLAKTLPSNRVTVKYKGIMPDTFQEGVIAISDGVLNKDGVFTADTVLAKCPSKYQESQKKDIKMAKKGASDKKTGRGSTLLKAQ